MSPYLLEVRLSQKGDLDGIFRSLSGPSSGVGARRCPRRAPTADSFRPTVKQRIQRARLAGRARKQVPPRHRHPNAASDKTRRTRGSRRAASAYRAGTARSHAPPHSHTQKQSQWNLSSKSRISFVNSLPFPQLPTLRIRAPLRIRGRIWPLGEWMDPLGTYPANMRAVVRPAFVISINEADLVLSSTEETSMPAKTMKKVAIKRRRSDKQPPETAETSLGQETVGQKLEYLYPGVFDRRQIPRWPPTSSLCACRFSSAPGHIPLWSMTIDRTLKERAARSGLRNSGGSADFGGILSPVVLPCRRNCSYGGTL